MEPIVAPYAADGSRVADVPLMAKRFQGASSFAVGFDVTEKEAEDARRKRAQRFGRELRRPPADSSATMENDDGGSDDDDGLSLSSGAPFDRSSFPDELPEGGGSARSDALYVFGVDDMSTSDVMKVFQTYNPNHLEWVNDQACVVVWQDVFSAKRALFALGRWELGRPPVATHGEESSSSEGTDDDDDRRSARNLVVAPKSRGSEWRVTSPVHNSQHLLLRFASEGDRKKRGAGQKSAYYRRHGNPHTGQGGEVSLSDLRARRAKKRPHGQTEHDDDDDNNNNNSGDVKPQPSPTVVAVKQEQSAADVEAVPMEQDQESAHLLIEVSNTINDGEDDLTAESGGSDLDSGHASPPPIASTPHADRLQTLTIKVEMDSDDELERRRDNDDAASPTPAPKRRRHDHRDGAASGIHDKEKLEKMCITFSVDHDADESERLEQQREQNRVLDEQRRAILERRRLRERLGHKPGNLSSVVVRPGGGASRPPVAHESSMTSSASAHRASPSREHGSRREHRHRHDDLAMSVKREEEEEDDGGGEHDDRRHRSADAPATDLRHRLKERRRDRQRGGGTTTSGVLPSSSGRFKPPVAGSLTITCDFEDR